MKAIRARLAAEGVDFAKSMGKRQLVTILTGFLCQKFDAATTTTTSAATDRLSVADPVTMKTGQCLEVYCDEDEKWYPCVVKNQVPDGDSARILCRYDDREEHLHNLRDVVYKLIRPTEDRIKKVGVAAVCHTCKHTHIPYTHTHAPIHTKVGVAAIRARLAAEGVDFATSMGKRQLVTILTRFLCKKFDAATTTTTSAATSAEPAAVRAKFGQSHKERTAALKQKLAEKRKVEAQTQEPAKKRKIEAQAPVSKTISQTVTAFGNHARALHTLATRGNQQSNRQFERDGYNVITFKQADLFDWGATSPCVPGELACLPKAVSAVYDTTGWICINKFVDGRVVMLRPPAPVPTRGDGAQKRRKKFEWTLDMGRWFVEKTQGQAAKTIPFVALVEEAEDRWGYLAPEQVGSYFNALVVNMTWQSSNACFVDQRILYLVCCDSAHPPPPSYAHTFSNPYTAHTHAFCPPWRQHDCHLAYIHTPPLRYVFTSVCRSMSISAFVCTPVASSSEQNQQSRQSCKVWESRKVDEGCNNFTHRIKRKFRSLFNSKLTYLGRLLTSFKDFFF